MENQRWSYSLYRGKRVQTAAASFYYFNLHDTAPGALTLPPPMLNFNQHCCATNTPALHPEVEWHTAQQASFELAGRTSSLDGSLSACKEDTINVRLAQGTWLELVTLGSERWELRTNLLNPRILYHCAQRRRS